MKDSKKRDNDPEVPAPDRGTGARGAAKPGQPDVAPENQPPDERLATGKTSTQGGMDTGPVPGTSTHQP